MSKSQDRKNWPEYWREGAGVGLFLLSACLWAAILEYPASPVHQLIASAFWRRMVMGLAMAGTVIMLVNSPWGKASGAHFNPAVTLTYLRLGRMHAVDAFYYVLFQMLGGLMGVGVAALLAYPWVSDASVNFAATQPGSWGVAAAFLAECIMTFTVMFTVLTLSNHPRYTRFTVFGVSLWVAVFITFEAPISGMSLNPARSFASNAWAQAWRVYWIYAAAPLLGMLAAAEVYLMRRGASLIYCAKLHHGNSYRCIFKNCRFHELERIAHVSKPL